jgi:hypothetical protein
MSDRVTDGLVIDRGREKIKVKNKIHVWKVYYIIVHQRSIPKLILPCPSWTIWCKGPC